MTMSDITKLRKIDSLLIPYAPREIRLFMVIRNESLRLPYLLKYYSRMGVDRFFFVDNGSTDGSTPFLLSQKNTHVFWTNDSYSGAHYGQNWMNELLHKYGEGHWCIVGDADEFFIYPHYEEVSLRDLSIFLDQRGSTVVNALVLDMYSHKLIGLNKERKGRNPLLTYPYFDKDSHYWLGGPHKKWSGAIFCEGGVRKRVFGVRVRLNKAPFLKFKPESLFDGCCHWVKGGVAAEIGGITLHFKFSPNFFSRILEEAKREEHWNNAYEYKDYLRTMINNPNPNLYYSHSVKFKDSKQLVDLGLMKTSVAFEAFVENLRNKRQNKETRKSQFICKNQNSFKTVITLHRKPIQQNLDSLYHLRNYHFLMTNYCNARCVFCNQRFDGPPRKEINLENFKIMLSHIPVHFAEEFCFSGGGEPLLCRDLFPIINYVKGSFPGIKIVIRTNGLLIGRFAQELASMRIDRIEISLHGLAETNDSILQRRGSQDIFQGIAFLNKYLEGSGNAMRKVFCPVVSKGNINELPWLVKKAVELKVDAVEVQFCRYFTYAVEREKGKLKTQDSLFFHQELYNAVIRKSARLARSLGVSFMAQPLFYKNFKKQPCRLPWFTMLIDWDGDVYPCLGGEEWFKEEVKSGEYYFGNVLKEHVYDFWNKRNYRMIREANIPKDKKACMPECKNCHLTICLRGPNVKNAHIIVKR